MSIKLKRCPFCGGEATMKDLELFEVWYVICESCFAASERYKTENEAIKAWNTRVKQDDSTERSEYDRGYDDAKADEYDKVTHLIENIKKEFEVDE